MQKVFDKLAVRGSVRERWAAMSGRERMTYVAGIISCVACTLFLVYGVLTSSLFQRFFMGGSPVNEKSVVRVVVVMVALAEVLRLFGRHYGRRDLFAAVIAAAMAIGPALNKWWFVACTVVVVFAVRDVEPRKLVRNACLLVSVLALGILLCSLVGIVPDIVLLQGTRVRHCFGFRYCLFPAQYLFVATCVWCWLRVGRMRLWEALLLVVANVAMYVLTDARLSAFLSVATVVVALIVGSPWATERRMRLPRAVLAWAFPLALLVTVVAVACYAFLWNPELRSLVDGHTGARVAYAYKGLETYGVTLLGQRVSFVGNGLNAYGQSTVAKGTYNYVDNLFAHTAIKYGLVFMAGVVFLYTRRAWEAHRQRDTMLVVVIAALAAHCLMDDLVQYLYFNVLMLSVASIGLVAPAAQEGEKVGGERS